jgi:hypothetical protein
LDFLGLGDIDPFGSPARNRPLFQMEQIAFGGSGSVGGYRTYLTVTDDGFLASGELWIPVGRLRLPYLAISDEAGTVQIAPFHDFDRAWNTDRPIPYPQQISGVGAGVRRYIRSGITAEFYYAKAPRHAPVGTSIEDRGHYFRITLSCFNTAGSPTSAYRDNSCGLTVISRRFHETGFVHERIQRDMSIEPLHFGCGGNRVVPKAGLRKQCGSLVRRGARQPVVQPGNSRSAKQ